MLVSVDNFGAAAVVAADGRMLTFESFSRI
jgi:NAD(P)-dependent dehydrogenase (short-subunit alcohol dehydrogenase family)